MRHHYPKYYLFRIKNLPLLAGSFLLALFHSLVVPAQTFRFQADQSVPVLRQGDTLVNAWTGGLNSAQYSTLRLNDDAVDDLVVFDRATGKLTTFVAERHGDGYRWRHAPRYETQFPAIRYWMLLVDYDQDGKKDIFTYTEFGMRVLRNTSSGGQPNWTTVADPLLTEGSSGKFNLSVPVSDIPAITDVDGDGDMDILSGSGSGHRVYWYQNQSMEKTGSPAQLDFRTASRCWGRFESKETCGQFNLNVDCGEERQTGSGRVQHAGSGLLALDLNQDGLKDLLFSDISCFSMTQLLNTGTLRQAQISSVLPAFPVSKPINLLFPAAYYEDLDFDGKKDLSATPNLDANEGNLVDFSRSNWFYKNTGTNDLPAFSFVGDDFLQNTMIDIGERSFPALADYDSDGDLDLFIGHAGRLSAGGLPIGTLTLYENTGTRTQAAFQWKTDDYLNFSALQASNLKPFFLDWNGDRAIDLVLMSTNRTNTDLKLFLNTATAGQPFQFSPQTFRIIPFTNLRSDFTPCFYDLDADGDWDILLGRNLGEVEYHRNTGSNTTPVYTRIDAGFAGLPLATFDRSQAPLITDWNSDGRPDLLTAYRNLAEAPYGGRLIVFSGITPNPEADLIPQTSILFDEVRSTYDTVPLPAFITPAAGDLDGDGLPDLVLGTAGGGVMLLKNTSLRGDVTTNDGIRLGPNPVADGTLYLTTETDSEVSFCSLLGQQLMEKKTTKANIQIPINVSAWAGGMYLVKVSNASGTRVRKFVVAN